jgi:hypothetical protein
LASNFLCLYRGPTIGSARVVAICTDDEVVTAFARQMLDEPEASNDPVALALEQGRRRALQLVRSETE